MSRSTKIQFKIDDVIEGLQSIPDNSFHGCFCDPPYGLSKEPDIAEVMRHWVDGDHYEHKGTGFMGKTWDSFVPGPEYWREVYRVLKPGAHALVFAGTRTQDLMSIALRFAGFEIRDTIMWVYGSGFPKSQNVSKAIAKRADPEKVREIKLWLSLQFERSGKSKAQINRECGFTASDYLKTEPGHDAGGRATWHLLLPYGEQWERLKAVVGFDSTYDSEIEQYGRVVNQRVSPKENRDIYGKYSGVISDYDLTDEAKQWDGYGTALKPAYEPVIIARKPLDGTVAGNVLKHGTGAINIDGCRIGTSKRIPGGRPSHNKGNQVYGQYKPKTGEEDGYNPNMGRFPANLIHDGSEEVVELFPETKSGRAAEGGHKRTHDNMKKGSDVYGGGRGISGTSSTDDAGTLYGDSGSAARFFYTAKASKTERNAGVEKNNHPTVKPLSLTKYLATLILPPEGTETRKLIVPFAGSASEVVGAMLAGWDEITAIELAPEYVAIAEARVMYWRDHDLEDKIEIPKEAAPKEKKAEPGESEEAEEPRKEPLTFDDLMAM